jgi:LAO/AO transport system kinase
VSSPPVLGDRVRSGDRRALALLLTLIENDDAAGLAELSRIYPQTGRAHVIGLTGAPGTGKSTLANRLALELRKGSGSSKEEVAVIAVDPTSPFTGGALLGDRIRMREAGLDPGVFIRSMASRGALGGVARRTADAIQALDAAGFARIIVETVGAGQADVEIARLAHSTVVVEAPGLGDDVQAIKAGVLEAADLLVVNKADLPGADETVRALRSALDLGRPTRPGSVAEDGGGAWRVPILRTVATRGEGIDDLVRALDEHRRHLAASKVLITREREKSRRELAQRLQEELVGRFLDRLGAGVWESAIEEVASRQTSPRAALRRLLGDPAE